MPEAQSKSFTLRLNAASEARADHSVSRREAIVIEQLATDLWWRRRDPNTKLVENIGRFNADKVDLSSTPNDGTRLSVSWVDYQGLLEDRLVLKYLDTVNSESMWAAGTAVTQIMRFAIPTNANVDLSNIQVGAADLGTIKEPFELPPGTTIATVMSNLQALSTIQWEWWVDMPPTDASRPRLQFAIGQRGSDKGVAVFDLGSGQGPIESWTMQEAGDRYANSIFYSGATGGVVYDLPSEIAQYGQVDASDQDSSLEGTIALIEAAAQKRLLELADRTPSWTLTLRQGFWEGRSHIDVGDWINVHIALGLEVMTGKHRVTEIQVDVDASGMEQVSLSFGALRPARDPRSRNSTIARLVRKLKAYERKGT